MKDKRSLILCSIGSSVNAMCLLLLFLCTVPSPLSISAFLFNLISLIFNVQRLVWLIEEDKNDL